MANPLQPLPPRRCDNCGKRYIQKQTLKKGQQYGFCKVECKKQFHKHGSAFIQVRKHITKEIERITRGMLLLVEPCELCRGKGQVRPEGLPQSAKLVSRPCPKCRNGAVLTNFGRDVLQFVEGRLKVDVETVVNGGAPELECTIRVS